MTNILVINQYASTPQYSTGAGERFYYLLEYFKRADYKMTVIAGGYSHLLSSLPPSSKLFNDDIYQNGKFVWVRLSKFNKNSFIGRFLSWIEFTLKLFFYNIKEPPKIVVLSSMSIFPIIYCVYLKRKYKAKLIVEIRDIWPLTPIKLGGYSRKNPIIWMMSLLEKLAYKEANVLVSVLPGFKDYIDKLGMKNKLVHWIPNAISKDLMVTHKNLNNITFDSNKFNVIYTGALGRANAMEYVIDAFNLIQDKNIELFILGDGPEKDNLLNRVINSNITFISKVSKSEVAKFIKKANLCIISWRQLDIYEYGVSANKYNDYMMCEKPILSASNIKTDLVNLAKCGICVEPENPEAIKDGIIYMNNLDQIDLKIMGQKGKQYLIQNQTYEVISIKYLDIFNQLCSK